MSNVLLRILRFQTSVLLPSAEEFFRQELTNKATQRFEDDLSIFECLDAEVVQAHAEFLGNGLTPRSHDSRGGVDLQGVDLPEVKASPGASKWFKFFRERHRAVCLFDEEEALALARSLFVNILARERSVTAADVRAFVKARLAQPDPEWFACLNDSDPAREGKCRDWRKWLEKQPPKPKHAATNQAKIREQPNVKNANGTETHPPPTEQLPQNNDKPPSEDRPTVNHNDPDGDE